MVRSRTTVVTWWTWWTWWTWCMIVALLISSFCHSVSSQTTDIPDTPLLTTTPTTFVPTTPLTSTTPTTHTTTTTTTTPTTGVPSTAEIPQDDKSDEVTSLRAGLIVVSIIAAIAIGIIIVGVILKVRKSRRRQQSQEDGYVDVIGDSSNPSAPQYSKAMAYGKDKTIAPAVMSKESPSSNPQVYANEDATSTEMTKEKHQTLKPSLSVSEEVQGVYEDMGVSTNPGNVIASATTAPKNLSSQERKTVQNPTHDETDGYTNSESPQQTYENFGATGLESTENRGEYSSLDNSTTYSHTYADMK